MVESKNNKSILLLLSIILGQIVRVTIFQRRRDPDAFATVDESAAIAVLLIITGSVILLLSKNGQASIKNIQKSNYRYLVYYYFFCAISSLWSNRIEYSLFRAIEMIVNAMLIFNIFAIVEDKKKAFRILLFIILCSTLFGMASIWRNRGITFVGMHVNDFTAVAGMGLVLCSGLLLQYRLLSFIEIAFGILFFSISVIGGSSASSLVSTFIGLILLNMFKSQGKISLAKLFVLIIIVFSIYNYALIPAKQILFPGKSDHTITTMTGRTRLWKIYIDGFFQKPILGWGFAVGEKEAGKFGFGTTSSSHNGLLSVAINTGTVGLIIFLYAFMKIITSYYRAFNNKIKGASILFAALTVGLINNMTYPIIGSQWFFPSTSIWSILAFSNFFIWNYNNNEKTGETIKKPIKYVIRW